MGGVFEESEMVGFLVFFIIRKLFLDLVILGLCVDIILEKWRFDMVGRSSVVLVYMVVMMIMVILMLNFVVEKIGGFLC